MDPLTLELFRCLQSEPYDESGLQRIRGLLSKQRRALAAQRDVAMLGEIVHLLEDWALAAADARVGVRALQDAASIAERELKDSALAARLRASGRTAIAAASGREAISAARAREAVPAARAARAAPGARDMNPALQARSVKPANVERAPEPQLSGAAAHVAQARKCQTAGDIDGAIEGYEQALNAEAELATVRQLADLFAQRAGAGDAQQAADLYCTLGELLGNPEGVAMLERALAQCPEHTAAKALLAAYTGAPKPAQRRSPLDSPSARAAVQAKVQAPPLTIVRRDANKGPPPLAAATFALPSGSPSAPVSSLTPVVRQEVAEVLPQQRPSSLRRWLAIGGLLTAGSAAAAAFVVSQGRFAASGSMTSLAASAHGATPSENAAPASPVLPPSAPVAPSVAAASGVSVPTAGGAAPLIAAPAGAPAASSSASADKPAATDSSAVAPTPATSPTSTDDTNARPAAAKASVAALFDLAKLSGGKLNPAQLSAALDKTTPKLERCYGQLLKKKPRAKGRLTFQWTVRLNGKIASLKKLNDTINDATLTQCTQQAIVDTRFPKPRKQAVQVKLPFEYRRSPADS
jgi:tetratricopeptide (TPR) repeat protein